RRHDACDLRAQDLRRGLRHDQRQLQHRRARAEDVQPSVSLTQQCGGERGGNHLAHRRDPSADFQREAIQGCGGQAMSVATAARPESTAAVWSPKWIAQRFSRVILHVAVNGLTIVWIVPTFVLVLSFFVQHGIVPDKLTEVGLPPWLGLWLAHAGYGLPFSTYLLANFFRALPSDLFESAEIDGAGTLTVFFRIILPLSVPALASLIIFQFLWVWNDVLVALIYVGGSPDVAPLTVNLADLTNSLGQNYQLLTSAAFFSMVIPIVVFLSLQRYFVRGILAGSVKG